MPSSLIPKVGSSITARGLGDLKEDSVGNFFELKVKINTAVYTEELYYPTTGVYSQDETIDGWYWDRTHTQAHAELPVNEITDHIGGYKYNLEEGIPESYYQGAVLNGCDLIDVKGSEKWTPVLSTGMYSINGVDRQLYSDASICKRMNADRLDINRYNKDNITLAIYERDADYVKQKYREFKENSVHYKYEINEGILSIDNNRTLVVGSSNVVLEDTRESFEELGHKTNTPQRFYTKYFPIENVEVRVSKPDTFEVLDSENYTVDKDLGAITIDTEEIGQVFASYTAVPRVDLEIDPNVGFSSELDLKSHNWKQSNGIIEISSEDKHVAKIELTVDSTGGQPDLEYGTSSLKLKARALDSRGNPVDEVLMSIESQANDNQEVRFEGNLLNISGETNSDGSLFTRISAPLNDESSSFFIPGGYRSEGFALNANLINSSTRDNVLNNTLIFEVLKVDPFKGSNGLSLDVVWDENEEAFEIQNNFESEDYKLFRNALKNVHVKSETGAGCFRVFYNSGFIEYIQGRSRKVAIKKITKNYIYVYSGNSAQTVELRVKNNIKLFRKNENYSGPGLERLLYKQNPDPDNEIEYIPVRADGYNNGLLEYSESLGLAENDRVEDGIVSGYRIFVPRQESLIAKCIDPASNLVIQSAPLKINLNLSAIYKSVLKLSDEEETRLGVASHLSYDPVGNNIYFEADQ